MKEDLNYEETRTTRIISQQIPPNFDFGLCAIGETETRLFRLTNFYPVPVQFTFSPCAFAIEPLAGTLEPNVPTTIAFRIEFQEAKAIVAKTQLKIQNETPETIIISALGKYPYFSLTASRLDFGRIVVNSAKEVCTELLNVSEVGARFEIVRLKDDDFDDMSISSKEAGGFVPPGKAFALRFTFQPLIPDYFSSARFKVRVRGGNESIVELKGVCEKLSASFDRSLIVFNDLRLGSFAEESFVMTNRVPHKVHFEFVNLAPFFRLSKSRGVLMPDGQLKIRCKFAPTRPAHFFQRLFCLIKDRELLYIDLYAAGHELIARPLPLSLFIMGHLPPAKAEEINMTRTKQLPTSFFRYVNYLKDEEKTTELNLPPVKRSSIANKKVRLLKIPGSAPLEYKKTNDENTNLNLLLHMGNTASTKKQDDKKTIQIGENNFEFFFSSPACEVLALSETELEFLGNTAKPTHRDVMITNLIKEDLHIELQSFCSEFQFPARLKVPSNQSVPFRIVFQPSNPCQIFADTVSLVACSFAPLEYSPRDQADNPDVFFQTHLEKQGLFVEENPNDSIHDSQTNSQLNNARQSFSKMQKSLDNNDDKVKRHKSVQHFDQTRFVLTGLSLQLVGQSFPEGS